MNLDLAQMYGTPGYEEAASAQQEDMSKVAQAELFAKLAADNNIDLQQLSDEQISQLWGDTFGVKLAEEEEEEEEEKEEEEEEKKKESAAQEFLLKKAAAEEWQAKLAEADYLGRVMAHSYVQELGQIGDNMDKEAGAEALGARAGKALGRYGELLSGKKSRELGGKAEFFKKRVKAMREADAAGGAAGKAARERGARSGAAAKEEAKKVLKTRLATGGAVAALGGGGYAATRGKKKESSALDELAAEHAIHKAAEAGYDVDEAADRVTAVYTLGLGESEKIASADTPEEAVETRSLEFLEAAGYPVNWE